MSAILYPFIMLSGLLFLAMSLAGATDEKKS